MKEKSGWKVDEEKDMKKIKIDNNLMLGIISYGGFSNQITDDYFSNNQVYSKLLEEQSKYDSGALVTYGDKQIFNLDKALTINTDDIYIRKDLSLSEMIFFYEKVRIKK